MSELTMAEKAAKYDAQQAKKAKGKIRGTAKREANKALIAAHKDEHEALLAKFATAKK